MARDENLPFPRGETWFGHGSSVQDSDTQTAAKRLCGRRYVVEDPDYPGFLVTLMIVQYDAATPGTALTADDLCVDYTSGSIERVFADFSPTDDAIAHPLDHKYDGKSITDGDLVYVVVDGPVICTTSGDPTVGINVATNASGVLVAAAAADTYVVGYVWEGDTGGANHDTIIVGRSRGVES